MSLPPPPGDQDPGLHQRIEDLAVQQLIARPAVEALVVSFSRPSKRSTYLLGSRLCAELTVRHPYPEVGMHGIPRVTLRLGLVAEFTLAVRGRKDRQ